MGLLRETLALAAGRLVALVAGIAASLILARRLAPLDYAVYQYAVRKLLTYVNIATVPFAYWAYRYLARRIEGAGIAFLAITLLLELVSLAALTLLLEPMVGSTGAAAVLGFCTILLSINVGLSTVVPARDAKRVSVSLMLRSIIYSGLIVVEWYTRTLNLTTVAAACIIANLTADILMAQVIYDGRLCTRCIREWLRAAWLPLIGVLASIIRNLDATILVLLGLTNAIAAFYATSILVRLTADLAITSLQRVEAYMLEAREYTTPLAASRMVYTLLAFATGYAIAQPVQVAAITGPRYATYAPALPLIAISMLIGHLATIVSTIVKGYDKSLADKPGMLLKQNSVANLVSAIVYIALFSLTIPYMHSTLDALTVWAITATIAAALLLTLRLRLLPASTRRSVLTQLIVPTLGYTALASLLILIVTRPEYRVNIVEHVLLMAREAGPALLAYYAILLVVDPGLRGLVQKLVPRIRGGRAG